MRTLAAAVLLTACACSSADPYEGHPLGDQWMTGDCVHWQPCSRAEADRVLESGGQVNCHATADDCDCQPTCRYHTAGVVFHCSPVGTNLPDAGFVELATFCDVPGDGGILGMIEADTCQGVAGCSLNCVQTTEHCD